MNAGEQNTDFFNNDYRFRSRTRTSRSSVHEKMWKVLDKLGILYFPRSGTDLGIARGSSYLSSDGNLDIFVDMSQRQLLELSKTCPGNKAKGEENENRLVLKIPREFGASHGITLVQHILIIVIISKYNIYRNNMVVTILVVTWL